MDTTGHHDNDTALAPTGDSTVPAPADHGMRELEQHLGDLAASPQFVPLMGSFRDLLETERRRNRMRTLLIGAGMIVMLAVFIWGPLHLIRTYISQSEQRMAAERDSLQRIERSLNESMTVLSDASRELRRTLESYRQASATGTPPAVESATPATAVAPPASIRPVAPVVIAMPTPHPVAVVATASPPPVVTVTPPPSSSTGKVAVVVPPPAVASHAPPVQQALVPAIPPDVFRAVTSTPAVPVSVAVVLPAPGGTNRVAPATATEARLNDVLADVERTIQALRAKGSATNAAGVRKP